MQPERIRTERAIQSAGGVPIPASEGQKPCALACTAGMVSPDRPRFDRSSSKSTRTSGVPVIKFGEEIDMTADDLWAQDARGGARRSPVPGIWVNPSCTPITAPCDGRPQRSGARWETLPMWWSHNSWGEDQVGCGRAVGAAADGFDDQPSHEEAGAVVAPARAGRVHPRCINIMATRSLRLGGALKKTEESPGTSPQWARPDV